MISLKYKEPDCQEWNDWKTRCQEARDRLADHYQNGIKPDFNEALYKEMKRFLFGFSFGKCAYCETRIVHIDSHNNYTPGNQPGDVEHYRPKGKVTDLQGDEAKISDGTPHPGYFWLAYSWDNLFLACRTCNSPHTDKESGKLRGKGTRFPLDSPPSYSARDEKIETEKPLFLNPFIHDIEKHIKYVPKTGQLSGLTLEGRITIEELDLNRPLLVEQRQALYTSVMALIATTTVVAPHGDGLLDQIKLLQDYGDGRREFAVAARTALIDYADKLRPIYEFLSQYVNP